DVVRIDCLVLVAGDARPDPQQAVSGSGEQRAVMGDTPWEDIGDRDLERDREDVEAREHILRRGLGTTGAGNSAEVTWIQVHEIENALLVELIWIVELAGNDPAAVHERVDERVDESLGVKAVFTARRIPGVVTLEGAEAVNEPIGLRAVVVWQ